MIVVTNVKTVMIDNELHRTHVTRRDGLLCRAETFEAPYELVRVTTEMIEGKRFKNAYGWEVTIGWDKQTQESLGLSFEVFENQERKINNLQHQLDAANHLIRKYRDKG